MKAKFLVSFSSILGLAIVMSFSCFAHAEKALKKKAMTASALQDSIRESFESTEITEVKLAEQGRMVNAAQIAKGLRSRGERKLLGVIESESISAPSSLTPVKPDKNKIRSPRSDKKFQHMIASEVERAR